MEPITLTNSEEILSLMTHISLKGQGFQTECLMIELLDAGLSEPDYMNASGLDPEAYYNGEPNAWATYHVRQSKKVFMVYGGANKVRTTRIADTP